jgi:hypothetical protein
MSLTSYRAAPPRVKPEAIAVGATARNDNAACTEPRSGGTAIVIMKSFEHAFGRLGNDLLSQGLSHSTIGATALNDRVRNGIGFFHCARATKSAERMEQAVSSS